MLVKLLHFGRGGVGKSYAAATAVVKRDGFVIDTDDNWQLLTEEFGLEYVTDKEAETADLRGKVLYVGTNPEATTKVLRRLSTEYRRTGKPMVGLVVFDGYSEFGYKNAAAISKKRQVEWDASTKDRDGVRPDGKVPDQRGWGLLRADFQHITALMQPTETGAHLYATARIAEKKDPFREEGTLFRPAVDGSFGGEIESYFHLTFPTFRREVVVEGKKKNVRRTFFAPEAGMLTGARFAINNRFEHKEILPEFTDTFNVEDMLSTLEES